MLTPVEISAMVAVFFSLLSAWRSEGDLIEAIVSGLITGLTATGMYRAGKEVVKSRTARGGV